MSAFDALFGRLFSAGVELELKNGLDFGAGLAVTAEQLPDGSALWRVTAPKVDPKIIFGANADHTYASTDADLVHIVAASLTGSHTYLIAEPGASDPKVMRFSCGPNSGNNVELRRAIDSGTIAVGNSHDCTLGGASGQLSGLTLQWVSSGLGWLCTQASVLP